MRKEQIITTNNKQMEEKGMKNRFIHFKKRFVPAGARISFWNGSAETRMTRKVMVNCFSCTVRISRTWI